jgi:isopenicillin-N epimerase
MAAAPGNSMSPNLKSLFLLDPQIVFLNHGSFGACPKPVFETYQQWQRKLENQPVAFLGRDFFEYDRQARQALGAFLHADPDDLAFVTNATQGVNLIARSLDLGAHDEILTTDHEYGACDYAWEFICQRSGAAYARHQIPLPARSSEELVEQFWQGVTPRTKVIYLSHITSPTALHLPVEVICARARRAGILTLVDGAHAPGQIPLDLQAVGADFYTGNCHKWMLSPKGAGFLFARPEVQHLIEPLIVSWGYHAPPHMASGSRFLEILQWTGTRDPAAAFSVPAAIQFMQENDWGTVRQACHVLLGPAIQRICDQVEMEPPYPLDSHLYHQMGIAPLPSATDPALLKARLYDEYNIEVPLIEWNDRIFVRISVQGYNTQSDLDALYDALKDLLPQVQT